MRLQIAFKDVCLFSKTVLFRLADVQIRILIKSEILTWLE